MNPNNASPQDNNLEKKAENIEHSVTSNNKEAPQPIVSVSLRSGKTPSYTFTPTLKRPNALDTGFATMEEQAQIKAEEQKSTVQKNSGFTFPPVVEAEAETPPQSSQPQIVVEPKITDAEPVQPIETEVPPIKPNSAERIISPAHSTPAKKDAGESGFAKYRRILLVLLIALFLAALFWWLQPKNGQSDVESVQNQSTNLPLEFRPIDETEAKRAEENAQQMAQQAQAAEQQRIEQSSQGQQSPENQAETSVTAVETGSNTPENTANTVAPTAPQATASVAPTATEVAPVVKAEKNTPSVIYQKETPKPQTTSPEKKVERLKPATSAQTTAKATTKAERSENKTEKTAVTPKPAVNTTKSAKIATARTLTVPKGVSLMQVFRNHNLNISDVNAMSKANNIVSRLKANEKVTVRLDKNNRVVEMTIGSGGKFIRQSNGSYQFK